jgi:peptidylprolyl isomerase
VWANGFRAGKAADISFLDNRPYEWVLGSPTERAPPGMDEGVLGMREGGWRRIVVPDAYGDTGLRKISSGLGGTRFVGPKAPLVIQPHATAYFDIILLDGGSGRCARLLRPPGASELTASKLKSLMCNAKQEIY